jgi:hypothetical protein
MEYELNTDGVQELGRSKWLLPLVKDGKKVLYQGTIINHKEGYTKSNNDPKTNITIQVDFPSDYDNIRVYDDIIFYQPDSSGIKGLGKTIGFLHRIGEPYEGKNLKVNPDNWINKTVFFYAKDVTYLDGKVKSGVESYQMRPNVKEVVSTFVMNEPIAESESGKPGEDVPF